MALVGYILTGAPLDQRDADDLLNGFPKEPTHRGQNCPRAPFGRTDHRLGIVRHPDTRAPGLEIDDVFVAADGVVVDVRGRNVEIRAELAVASLPPDWIPELLSGLPASPNGGPLR